MAFLKSQPMFLQHLQRGYYFAKLCFDIELLEQSILSKNITNISKHKKMTRKNAKKAIRNSKKAPIFLGSSFYRFMGLYYWLNGKQNRAVKFWKKAIKEGERLDARPDLAKTYMEIGKRFLEEKNEYKELNGISAKDYLDKARAMFQEMDLQWDLDELDKIVVTA